MRSDTSNYFISALLPVITHFVILAVDCADSQQIENGRPGSSLIFAFFFHANEAGFRLVFSVVLDQGNGVTFQGIGSVAESCGGCLQDFRAGNPAVLLPGGCIGIAAVAGDDDLVGGGAGGGNPDSCQSLAHGGSGVGGSPVFEAQAVEEPGPGVVRQFSHTGADERVLGNTGDHGQAVVQLCDENETQTGLGRASGGNSSSYD